MKGMFKRLRLRLYAIRSYRGVLGYADAVRITRSYQRNDQVSIAVRGLPHPVTLRPGTSDQEVFQKIFCRHEYSIRTPGAITTIVDAGANLGLASIYFQAAFPNSTVLAIEPNPDNFRLLQRNCEPYPGIRCVKAGVWPHHTRLIIKNPDGEPWAFQVGAVPEESSASPTTVPSLTIPEILDQIPGRRISLLKIDIEGAERALFSEGDLGWLDQVDAIAIELHDKILPGCSQAFYKAIGSRRFNQSIQGENVCIFFQRPTES